MDFMRQEDIIPSNVIQNSAITLIGAGGIGSPTAMALAKMGIGIIHIFDGDIIEPHNLPNQFYTIEDNGEFKVNALRRNIMKYAMDCHVFPHDEHFNGQKLEGIVISAVDNMDTRSKIFSEVKKQKPNLYIEARMGAELMMIYSVNPSEDTEWYEKTLYTDEDAMELPCTARAIIYNVFVIGGLIASQVKKALMKQELTKEIIFDLVTMTLLVD